MAACPVCEYRSRPRSLTADANACLRRHLLDKAALGCATHQALYEQVHGHPYRQQAPPSIKAKGYQPLQSVQRLGPVTMMEHPNVYTCSLSGLCAADVRRTFEKFTEDRVSKTLFWSDLTMHVERPPWGKSDIRWISAKDCRTFEYFRTLWKQLGVAERFAFLGEMVMFAGYFVARRLVRKSHFHTDFTGTGDSAFTLMTPLYDMTSLSDCHLVGLTEGDTTKQYRYELGKAIVFGDNFLHATQTGDAPHDLVFLCFTFGKRRMTDCQWESCQEYISSQCPIYQSPLGKMVLSAS